MSLQVPPNLIGAKGTLYSLKGEELYTIDIQVGDTSIDVSEYAKGMYFFTIEKGRTRITKQVIKL